MSFVAHMQRCGRKYLAQLLAKHNGCVVKAAKEAGLNRTHMYEVLRRHGIEMPEVEAKPIEGVWIKRLGRYNNRGNGAWQAMQ